MDRHAVYDAATATWGAAAQIDVAIEEMAELTQALIHHRRGRADTVQVLGELADVVIMTGQLRALFEGANPDMLDDMIDAKIARLARRLKMVCT